MQTLDKSVFNGYKEEPRAHEMNEDQLFQKLADEYLKAVVAVKDLGKIPIKPRAKIIGDWMKEGDLGFIYGAQGSGKT
jgi:hypothetical protein